jgi:acetyl-CoA carboxylase biotin carboxylase subunit
MERALGEFVVEGIHTTIAFHRKVIASAEFRSGQFDTTFVERFFAAEAKAVAAATAAAKAQAA